MKSVLLTRSAEENIDTIKAIEQLGLPANHFYYISCPLIKYRDLAVAPDILDNYNNIIVTSKHAAKIVNKCFLAKSSNFSDKNAWVVGHNAASILQQSIFLVQYIAKDVEDLIENLPPSLYHQSIYLSSNHITQDLPIQIKRQVIYEVIYANKLQQIELLRRGVDYVLLHSSNCAKVFIQLLSNNNLLSLFNNALVITISNKVADIVRPFLHNVVYCNNNSHDNILELLISYDKNRR